MMRLPRHLLSYVPSETACVAPAVQNTRLRWAHSIGYPKTHQQHIFTAAATDVVRLVQWLTESLFVRTRTSRLAAVAA